MEVVKFLLESGASVNQSCGKLNFTALIAAANEGHEETVRVLLAYPGCDVNATKSNGYTALISACNSRYLNIANLLIEHGADVNKASATGCSALYLACSAGDIRVVKALLDAKADVNKPSNVSELCS